MSNTTVSGEVSSMSGEKGFAHSTNNGRLPGACRHANIQLPRNNEPALLHAMIPDTLSCGFQAIQKATWGLASPRGPARAEFDLERRAGVRMNLLRHYNQGGFRVFHGMTQAEPCG